MKSSGRTAQIGGKAAWDAGFEAAQLDYSGRVVTMLVPMCRKPDACFAYRMIGWTI
jgi:hypothetical protein